MIDKPASEMSADELWGAVTGRQVAECRQPRFDARYATVTCKTCKTVYQCTPSHDYYNASNDHDGECERCLFSSSFKRPVDVATDCTACVLDLCPYCASPVTNAQIHDGDAFPIDERGVDDQKYAHRECAQGARYEP